MMENGQRSRMRWVVFWVFVGQFCLAMLGTLVAVFLGFSAVTEPERAVLFNLFIGEVAVAVIALFYSLFRLKGRPDPMPDMEPIPDLGRGDDASSVLRAEVVTRTRHESTYKSPQDAAAAVRGALAAGLEEADGVGLRDSDPMFAVQVALREAMGANTLASHHLEEVCLLGFNNLGPMHQCHEILIELLSDPKPASLRVLLVDPESDYFLDRARREDGELGGNPARRLLAEFNATFELYRRLMLMPGVKERIAMRTVESLRYDCAERSPQYLSLMIWTFVPSPEYNHSVVLREEYPPDSGVRAVAKIRREVLCSLNPQETSDVSRLKKHFEDLWSGGDGVALSRKWGVPDEF